MTPRKGYFSLYELALLSTCGALVFVLKIALKVPIHVPGHSGIFWVIPIILGVGIVKKFGSGTYIGFISGILVSLFGLSGLYMFDFFEYLSMGMTIDFVGLLFSYAFDRPTVGFIAGAVGNIVKMVVNFAVQMVFGIPATFILIGIGLASVTHLVFGGLGGIFAALVLARLARAGVIPDHGSE